MVSSIVANREQTQGSIRIRAVRSSIGLVRENWSALVNDFRTFQASVAVFEGLSASRDSA